MIEYFLLILICFILLYSNFVHMYTPQKLMIAFVGHEHPRLFERQYITSNADLFVFRNRASNSINVKYEKKGTERRYFARSGYNYMLIVHMLQFYVPIERAIVDRSPTTYIHDNKTVAELSVKKTTLKMKEIFI